MLQETLLEDLQRVGGADAMYVDVAGARDYDVPELFDDRIRLRARFEELGEGPFGPRVPSAGAHTDDPPHGPRDVKPLAGVKELHPHE